MKSEPVVETKKDEEGNVGSLFLALTDKYGYSIGPQYLQFLRASIPEISIGVHLTRLKSALEAQGKDKTDPEVIAVDDTFDSLSTGFLYQLLYVKELHSDYNWSNLLVDNVHVSHLIDWGQSVSTKGLVLRPAALILAFMKGDAALVVKRLSQVGTFTDLTRDREAVTSQVQALMTSYHIERQTWRGLVADWITSTKKSKKSKDVIVNEKEVVSEPEATKQEASSDSTQAPVVDATKTATKTDKLKDVKSEMGKIVWRVVKMGMKYPYHRLRVEAIRGREAVRSRCSIILGL